MKENTTGVVGSSISWILSITQTNEIFQLIQIILASIVSLLTIIYIIWKWYKKATEDGKITQEEIDELTKEVEEHVNKSRRKDL